MLRARPGHHPLPGPASRNRQTPPMPGGIGSVLGLLTGTAATLLDAALGARTHPILGLVLLGGTALTVASLTSAAGALASATQCWTLWDGFLVNRFGELTLTRSTALALLLLTFAAPAAAVIASWLRAELLDSDPRNLANISLAHDETLMTHELGPYCEPAHDLPDEDHDALPGSGFDNATIQ